MTFVYFMIGLFVIFFIPSLIVIIWKRRPIWAFGIASILLYLIIAAPGIIKTFQAMAIYGVGDPELMAGEISEALVRALLVLPVLLLILALIQWIARRKYKRKKALSLETTKKPLNKRHKKAPDT